MSHHHIDPSKINRPWRIAFGAAVVAALFFASLAAFYWTCIPSDATVAELREENAGLLARAEYDEAKLTEKSREAKVLLETCGELSREKTELKALRQTVERLEKHAEAREHKYDADQKEWRVYFNPYVTKQ